MPYALRNKKTGRLLCVTAEKEWVCLDWETPYEEVILKLEDTEYNDIIFLTGKKNVAYALKRTGRNICPNIKIDLDAQRFGIPDIELKNLEIVQLKIKRKNSSIELLRKKNVATT